MKTIFVLSCLLYAMRTMEAVIKAEGFEGGEVSFQCSHSYAKTNTKYLCNIPCKRNEDVLLAVKPVGRAVSERITLEDRGDGVLTVTLSRLRLNDSGEYFCGVKRKGFDTYNTVHLTVKEGVASETTTIKPDPSPTWTYLNTSSSSQQTLKMNTSCPTSISTVSNCTQGGERSNSTGTLLFTTLGAVIVFTFLVLATWVRKRRESAKPHPPTAGTNSPDGL
ncbi:CMRF35-like molecule 1 [Notolabrus celidotus]|uniref:CMRF35-like molecule 1 n=1 Tax=Notolabrus celidotus TaxID=1203425 RepID=UPI00148F4CED|nr:CMRF35-like molecule 1 [Notolabrus celidotus]